MRLFVAIDLPTDVQEAVHRAAAPLRAALPRARWVQPELLHLTLAFLGEVDAARLADIAQALRNGLERAAGFAGRFRGLGAFPPTGRARVLWLGLEPKAAFEEVAARVRQGLAAAGAPFDTKPFQPHLTLARCDPPWPERVRHGLAALEEGFTGALSAAILRCDRVVLYSSQLRAAGPLHRPEVEIPLRAPAAPRVEAGA